MWLARNSQLSINAGPVNEAPTPRITSKNHVQTADFLIKPQVHV
ncbi:MAG: hypothetical protein JWQ71_1966 [Pedosphaera sp.]|nr:hypothetical protein [Pedosphaera sp.]